MTKTAPPNTSEAALKQERAHKWHAENAEALQASNRRVDEHGLPLADFQVLKID